MSTRWTPEQKQAIELDGTSIIVSAGAGSGKTAVLTERVIRKLREGVSLDQLLILTFTKAAAAEMKERIRQAMKRDKELHAQLAKLDSAYITTFDSYALSIVKRYHYVLNLPPQLSIVEPTLILLEKKKQLDQIMEERYEQEDVAFLNCIRNFCIKDDQELKRSILAIAQKLDGLYEKRTYLKTYIDTYYNPTHFDQLVQEYLALIEEKICQASVLLTKLEDATSTEYLQKVLEVWNPFAKATSYEERVLHSHFKLPILPRNTSAEGKQYKEELNQLFKEICQLLRYTSVNEMKEELEQTRETIEVFISILLELEERVFLRKQQLGAYEFHDISSFAIEIVRDHPDLANEIKTSLNEIMIDEYQDTNDIQETFISYIACNNVYMVGDIKQSIYRFRNANPYIFKTKYDQYQKEQGGRKIDLNKNFRSRREVLDDINRFFDQIMDDTLGGADYQSSHQMVFGNRMYLEAGKTEADQHLELLNYTYEKGLPYQKDEIEIFLIARDIKKKVETGFQVFDKDSSQLRPVTYQDFVILLDRSTKFELYKKIFEYEAIPLAIFKDETIRNGYDMDIITNLLLFIKKIKNREWDKEFEYCFVSLARSYLYALDDQFIFDVLRDKTIPQTELYQYAKELSATMEVQSCYELLESMFEKFQFYQKIITVGDVTESCVRFEYLLNLAQSLTDLGYNCMQFIDYMLELKDTSQDIRYSLNTDQGNSVKIMTIHKSKGLEYPICYYSGLSADFNMSDLKERFFFQQQYGFIVPINQEGLRFTIVKDLAKYCYQKEEISEKIRLFYVALTRSREKLILVTSMTEHNSIQGKKLVPLEDRLKYRSFQDIVDSIGCSFENYRHNIKIEDIGLTRSYRYSKQDTYQSFTTEEPLEVIPYQGIGKRRDKQKYSKEVAHLYSKDEVNNIEFGKYLHTIFEWLDFCQPDLNSFDEFTQHKVQVFFDSSLFQQPVLRTYREYEFEDDGNHGVIDLILEYKDSYAIVDYKLKNLSDTAYKEQLYGYRRFLQQHVKKPISLYLYSILEGELVEIS